jgi:hypothetical protein
MGLIPEEWFVKKSAVTGQETYFVREVICERIETILGLKDSLSLDEIADQLKKSERQSEHMLEITWAGGKVNIPLESIVSLCIVDSYGEECREESEKLRCVLAGVTKKGNN